ncbi:MAG: NADAR family protein [Rhizomicrobium sp.]
MALYDLGPRENACAEPINVTYDGAERWRPISNLAHTPFELDGRPYASVEGFWQGLKFASPDDRARIASLWGAQAKAAGRDAPAIEQFVYEGRSYDVGRSRHWRLMARACRAKFSQNAQARAALEATGDRPLTHHVRNDSLTIPGVIMADIWMRVRRIITTHSNDADVSE